MILKQLKGTIAVIIILIMNLIYSYSQDTIVKIDNQIVICKIFNIENNEISYLKDSLKYVSNLNKIKKVIYSSGKEIYFYNFLDSNLKKLNDSLNTTDFCLSVNLFDISREQFAMNFEKYIINDLLSFKLPIVIDYGIPTEYEYRGNEKLYFSTGAEVNIYFPLNKYISYVFAGSFHFDRLSTWERVYNYSTNKYYKILNFDDWAYSFGLYTGILINTPSRLFINILYGFSYNEHFISEFGYERNMTKIGFEIGYKFK